MNTNDTNTRGRSASLLEKLQKKLERDTKTIPVFGNIYPPVPMQQNFINLSLICDDQFLPADHFPRQQDKEPCIDDLMETRLKKRKQDGRDEWLFHQLRENKKPAQYSQINVDELFAQYPQGIIFGLPGAGKTTILRHIAFNVFLQNRKRPQEEKHIVLFVPCRYISHYDQWYSQVNRTKPGRAPVTPYASLEFMTYIFLFHSRPPAEVERNEWDEYQFAVSQVKQACAAGCLTLLVDALDEAPDRLARERIKELFLSLCKDYSHNRMFLTSRPAERLHLKQDKMPEFSVLSLTMEQVRAVGKNLMAEDSAIYKAFDTAVWQEELVVKTAATPMTALLVTAYFQAYGKFDHRFPMYDLLMKFILQKVWETIKEGTFPYDNLELFFKEIKETGGRFFEIHRETGVMYEALAALCFELFYDGDQDRVWRQVNDETLLPYFEEVIKEKMNYSGEDARQESLRWKERLVGDHLLLRAGAREYVFVHSTFMEFLAAHHLVWKTAGKPELLRERVRNCMENEVFLELETLPMAAGAQLETGFTILGELAAIIAETDLLNGIKDRDRRLHLQAVRCLAEVEWMAVKLLQGIRIKRLKQPYLDLLFQHHNTMEWVYQYLVQRILTSNKEQIKLDTKRLGGTARLSREILLADYLDYGDFNEGDSELVSLRTTLLETLVQKEVLDKWLKGHRVLWQGIAVGDTVDIVWQLDTADYNPEDKNFNYYRGIIGDTLVGILGSPNFRHDGEVMDCAFSPDGKTIISASADKTLKLWEARTGKEIRSFSGHKSRVNCSTFSPDGKTIISASDDRTLKLWKVHTGNEIRTFTGHNDFVFSSAFSPNGEAIISASADKTLKLWETCTGKEILAFTGHYSYVRSSTFSPDGETIISASDDNTLKLWETRTGKKIRTFTGHNSYVRSCAFSPDSETIISASDDKTLKLWETRTGKEIRTFKGHSFFVQSSAFSPNGKTIISASDDNTLRLWKVHSGKEVHTFTGHNKTVNSSTFSPNGRTIISASNDNTLKLWEARTGKEIRAFTGHHSSVNSNAFSPNGRTIISASNDNTLKLWEARTGKEILTLNGHNSYVLSSTFSPDGKTIISASVDETLKLWEARTGREIRAFTGHRWPVNSSTFSPDGETIISASYDRTLKLWDTHTGKEIRSFTGHNGYVYSCAFSPDSETIISASDDGTLKLWETRTSKAIHTFTGHKSCVLIGAFSPDGETIISASGDTTLKLWETRTGKEIRTFTGHLLSVNSSAFSPDGATIISVSDDRTLKVWETATGKEILSIPLPWTPNHVSVSPKKPGLVLTSNRNGTLALFQLPVV